MHFSLAPGAAGRRGHLLLTGKQAALATPTCLLNTVRGSVPHLTRDMVSHTGAGVLHVSAAHFAERTPTLLERLPGSLHQFINAQDCAVVVDLMDPAAEQPSASGSDRYITVTTQTGQRKWTAQGYAAWVKSTKPGICVAPSDPLWAQNGDVPTQRRAHKASRRTVRYLDAFLDTAGQQSSPVLAVLQGAHYPEERHSSAVETSKRSVDGFALYMRDLPSTSAATLLRHSLSPLPSEKPRFAFGVTSIEQVLEAVQAGVDVLDAAFIQWSTDRGHALQLALPSSDGTPAAYQLLDLWSSECRRDFGPFTHEMLAHVLLAVHNAYQYEQFFAQIRAHMDADTLTAACDSFMACYRQVAAASSSADADGCPATTAKALAEARSAAVTPVRRPELSA